MPGNDPFAPTEAHRQCFYCGSLDPNVEAGGIYYCPEETCLGPSGGMHRHVRECGECKIRETNTGTEVLAGCAEYERRVGIAVPSRQEWLGKQARAKTWQASG